MTDEPLPREHQDPSKWPTRETIERAQLETAADLIEQLAHELVATNERLVQLEARLEALERM